MNAAQSVRSLLGFQPPTISNGVAASIGAKARSDQNYDDQAQQLSADNSDRLAGGEIDPFYTMKLGQIGANKMSPWSPFYQALSDANGGTLPKMRFADYNPKGEAMAEANRDVKAFGQMPFKPTPDSYPQSVRQLFASQKGY